jgi:hypothetical protein
MEKSTARSLSVFRLIPEQFQTNKVHDTSKNRAKKIPVGARFFAQDQTGPGAHPASCTIGTGSFPGVKRPGRGVDHPPLLAPRSRMSSAIPSTPPLGPW